MAKELFVSSSPHETKVAILEDSELVEVYFERDIEAGLVGGIYKGRVRRVLPGMQSAFVDIGLERDAFLYVSDFFEDSEEYEKVVAEAEAQVARFTEGPPAAAPPQVENVASEPAAETAPAQTIPTLAPLEPAGQAPASAASAPAESPATPPPTAAVLPLSARPEDQEDRHHDHRGRRRRRGRRGGFGDQRGHRFGPPKPELREPRKPQESSGFEILPGESLAKYGHTAPEAAPAPSEAPVREEAAPGTPQEPESSQKPETDAAATQAPVVAEEPPQQTARAAPTAEPTQEAAGQVRPTEPALKGSVADVGEQPSAADEAPAADIDEELEHEPVPFTEAVTADWKLDRGTEGPAARAEEGQPVLESGAGQGSMEEQPAEAAETKSPNEAGGVEEPPEEALEEVEVRVEEEVIEVPEAEPVEPAVDQSGATPTESAAAQPGAPDAAATSHEDRSYTLRESSQRPRYAPRRGRRGRRGPGQRPPFRSPEAPRPRAGNDQPVQISHLLKEGQEILVQIAKEPLGGKGARITSHIALPGRYLVYMPTISHIGVSRKIVSEEERLRLRNIILENRGPLTGGFIVRTAGAGRSEEEFKADLRFLSTLWTDIRTRAEQAKAPALLHRDLDLVQRILRDILSPDFKCVRVDNEVDYERVVDFVHRSQPALVGQVKLYDRETPMFEEFGIQAEIEKALKPKVWLKSGGFIVINQTEALVAIDVNTGKYVGKTNRLEDTIVKTNIDAVKEIVRQVRLRDLGGIIVIDFIDMDERRNRQKVVQALEEALRTDRAPTNILSINEFGLVALTRKRVKHSLERTLCEPCSYCSGSGWVKSVATVCNEILGEVRKMARHLEGKVVSLRVNPEVAKALKSRNGVSISELESLTHKDIIVRSDPTVPQERFEIF
jgi:ribonuclease G